MQDRAERYQACMANVSEKVAGHLESMHADEILLRSAQRSPSRFKAANDRTMARDNASEEK